VSPALQNPLRNLHGGISLCASELAATGALRGDGRPSLVTASVHVVYVRPAPSGRQVLFTSTVTHRGRSLASVDVVGRVDSKPVTLTRVTAHAASS
jgi:acyl-coenzyme A thioesterase PaaI-like protein